MTESRKYWRDREEWQRQKNITAEAAYNAEIEKIHKRMIKDIQDNINAFYTRYADSEGLTLAEAKKKVSAFDVEAFSEKAARYVKNKDFSKRANEELRIYNAAMRINRLELLKSEIGLDMVDSYDELEKLFGEKLTERSLEEFRRQAGILGKSVIRPEKLAHSIVNASFHNATFSDRVWAYQDILKSDLDKLLREALIQGLNPRTLVSNVLPNISKTVGNKRSAAMRLLSTELCRVQIDAQMKSFERNGYDKYIFLAEPTACPHCRALDDKVFDVKEAMPGENAPPLHPNCRCSTAAESESDAEYDKWFYETTGKHSAKWELDNTKKEDDISLEKIEISKKVKKQQLQKRQKTEKLKREFKDLSLDEFKAMKGNCTAEERKIIYGRLKKAYIASGEAKDINESLRIGKSLDEHQQKVADTLRTVISKNTIKDDIMVYRYVGKDTFSRMTGIQDPDTGKPLPTTTEGFAKMRDEFNSWIDDLPNQIKKGKVYKEKAFFSTSGVFDKNVFAKRPTLIKLKVPKGAKGYVTTNNRESEIIFDRPEILINAVEYDKSTQHYIINCELKG